MSISQTNTITTGNSKALCLCMVLIHIMTLAVAMVDCAIVIVYTLHVWGPLELVIKRRHQRQFALEING